MMMMMKKKKNTRLAAASVAIAGVAVAAGPQSASADITGFWWSQTISQGMYSNVVGFWQEIGQYQACQVGGVIDGIFGPLTTAQSYAMLSGLAGSTYVPPVNSEWTTIQTASSIYGPRLVAASGNWGVAGNYSYYNGGANSDAELYYEGSGGRWKFRQGSSTNWYWATTARTMGSAAPIC